jgi:DNA polymerase III alpha subunit
MQILGFTVGGHLLHRLAIDAPAEQPVPCAEIGLHLGRRITVQGWPVATRRVRTAQGGLMRFLTLEDASGVVEAILFPPVYARIGHRLVEQEVLRLRGVVEAQYDAVTLRVESLR